METNVWNLRSIGKEVATLRQSQVFRGSATNATYSVAEYVAQPLLMIAAAPFLVHRLGLDLYGIWMLVSAIAGTVGIFGLGLSDATMKYVSAYRGRNRIDFQTWMKLDLQYIDNWSWRLDLKILLMTIPAMLKGL